jgi:hypothetical protein
MEKSHQIETGKSLNYREIGGIWDFAEVPQKRMIRDANFVIEFLRRSLLLFAMALFDDGTAQAGAKIFRQFVQLGVAINFDGLFGGIANHIAVVAPGEMVFEFGLCAGVDDAIQVIG